VLLHDVVRAEDEEVLVELQAEGDMLLAASAQQPDVLCSPVDSASLLASELRCVELVALERDDALRLLAAG
jgi:hypothetical protein